MKVVEDGVYISVKPRKTRTVVVIDVNFDNITLAVFTPSGMIARLKRLEVPLRRIPTRRIRIERIQRRYSKPWEFVKGVKEAVERQGMR
ncbi:MAG: hypothetical protein QW543_00330 [Sulfolobales archaeon]